MKLVFICGSLEPGRDGVGDYCRTLSAELIRVGHDCRIVALNDRKIDSSSSSECIQQGIKCLRLSNQFSWEERIELTKKWFMGFDPDWISLQFVPYAYHDKGLPYALCSAFDSISAKVPRQVMIHELWRGLDRRSVFRSYLVGLMQRLLIAKILRSCRFSLFHTHLPEYSSKVKTLGHGTLPLPLFSNIPVRFFSGNDQSRDPFRVSLFGQLEVVAPMQTFLTSLRQAAFDEARVMEIAFIGGSKETASKQAKIVEDLGFPEQSIKVTGFLDEDQVSAWIAASDLGLSSVPRHAIGKSGSIAAFLAHGIPVATPCICPSRGHDIGFFPECNGSAFVLEPDFDVIQKAKVSAVRIRKQLSVSVIADTFIRDLEKKNESG